MAGQYATAGNTIKASHFINSGAKDATPSNDNGRMVALENVGGEDAKVHYDFLPNYPIVSLTAGEAINDRDFVFINTSETKIPESPSKSKIENQAKIEGTSDYVSQTITTPGSGEKIDSVELIMRKQGSPSGTIQVALQEVSSNDPDGTDLAVDSVGIADIVNTQKKTFSFDYTHTPGKQYAVVVRPTGSSTLDSSNEVQIWGDNPEYPFGFAQKSTDSGSTWSFSGVPNDLAFALNIVYSNNSQVYQSNTKIVPGTRVGVAIGSIAQGNTGNVQFEGLVGGFSSLTPGEKYYLLDSYGDNTTQFDITNPSGTTFRYTYDGNGTDPLINSDTIEVGDTIHIKANNFNTNNNGVFTVTGVGSDYFEVDNSSGVTQTDTTLGDDSIIKTNGKITSKGNKGMPVGYAVSSTQLLLGDSTNIDFPVEVRSDVTSGDIDGTLGEINSVIGTFYPQGGQLEITQGETTNNSGAICALVVGKSPILTSADVVMYRSVDPDEDINLGFCVPAGSYVVFISDDSNALTNRIMTFSGN